MKRIASFFQRLQWKLTLSYAFVSVGTVIVLAAVLVGIAIYTESQANTAMYGSFFWSKTAFQDNVPYLMDDRAALQAWLERVQKHGFAWTDFQSHTTRETLNFANTMVSGTQPVYVLDPKLNLVAEAPLDSADIGKPFKARTATGPLYESILDAALVGDKNYVAQSYSLPDGTYVVAFPLRRSDNDPVAAIVVYTLRPLRFAAPVNLSIYTTFFVIITVLMLLVALPVGAIFGWMASRGLRTRLGALSTATRSWSRGDFSVQPRDRSGDEIGELTRNMAAMAEQLQALLNTRNELARIEERNRLARDLHDTVKQQTYAARMQLSAAKNVLLTDPAAAAGHLESALRLNRDTQQELKLIIDELRPAALQGRGLAEALRELAQRWQQHTGTPVEIAVSDERALPLAVEQALYRVVQEALSNVARHAEAERVALSLSMSADRVTLIVADNGRGFDRNAIPEGTLGLASMRQRLADVGGTLAIDAVPLVGTTLTAEVELSPAGVGEHDRLSAN